MNIITEKPQAIAKSPKSSLGLIIFAHIPKTAGTTINSIIDANYQHSFDFYPSKKQPNSNIYDWIDNFHRGIKEVADSQPKMLRGHIGLGIHDLLGIQNCTYVTLLRDPVERVISHYYFLDQIEGFFDDSYLEENNIKEKMTLEKFVYERKDIIADNLQTRFISGLGWQKSYYKDLWNNTYRRNFRVKYGECTKEMLARAKSNLKNYVIFGLQNRFSETLELYKNALGWKDIDIQSKKNVNKKRPTKEQLDPNLVKFIQQENYLDMELYNYARETFDEQFKNIDSATAKINSNTTWSYPRCPKNRNHQNSEVPTLLNEANQLSKAENYSAAIDKYKEVLTINPEYIPALFKLAISYLKHNSYERAIFAYERIVELNPQQDEAYARLAKTQATLGNTDLAIANFKKAINLNIHQPDWVFIQLGKMLQEQS